jgi:periplasmic divalent cation tolerance protein
MKTQNIIVLVTTSSKKEAENIATELLKNKLIGCANIIGPISSHFHWEGKIQNSEEFLMILKSRSDLFEKLSEKVSKLHSYDVPEILALPVVLGSKSYLEWLNGTLV